MKIKTVTGTFSAIALAFAGMCFIAGYDASAVCRGAAPAALARQGDGGNAAAYPRTCGPHSMASPSEGRPGLELARGGQLGKRSGMMPAIS